MKNILKEFYNKIFFIKNKILNYIKYIENKINNWKKSGFENKFLEYLYLNLNESELTKRIREEKKISSRTIEKNDIDITDKVKSIFKWFSKTQ